MADVCKHKMQCNSIYIAFSQNKFGSWASNCYIRLSISAVCINEHRTTQFNFHVIISDGNEKNCDL